MTETESFSGQYFDGKTARSRTIAVDVTDAGVCIREAGGLVLAVWPAGSVRLSERYRLDRPVRLRNDAGDEARLTIDDPAAYETLERFCPDLRRGEGRLRDNWKSILAWSGGAAASIALLVLVGIPFLATLVVDAIPPEAETAMGESIVDQVSGMMSRQLGGGREPQFCETEAGRAALDRLTARLTAGQDTVFPLTVRVLDVPVANAFALPGGQIVLLAGVIGEAEDAAELAGVLAHEIGHVVHRHPLETVVKQAGVATLLGFLIGDVSGSTIIIAGTQLLLVSSYTRDAEREADNVAIEWLNGADISGSPMAAFFDRLAAKEAKSESVMSLIGTHPLSRERADGIREASRGSGPAMSDSDWRALRSMCDD